MVAATASRAQVNMVSAVEQRGRLHFQVTEGSFTAACFVEFCCRLLADDGGPVFLVVATPASTGDGRHRLHSGQGGAAAAVLPARLHPKLNPDEWV